MSDTNKILRFGRWNFQLCTLMVAYTLFRVNAYLAGRLPSQKVSILTVWYYLTSYLWGILLLHKNPSRPSNLNCKDWTLRRRSFPTRHNVTPIVFLSDCSECSDDGWYYCKRHIPHLFNFLTRFRYFYPFQLPLF